MKKLDFNPYKHHGLFYGGIWQASSSKKTINITSPCNEQLIASITAANKEDTKKAIASAENGLTLFRKTNALSKSILLNKIADIMLQYSNDAIYLLAKELGKPFAQGKRDWELAIEQFRWFAIETRKLEGDIIDSSIEGCRYELTFEPVGIVGAFTAWNFPPLLAARKIAPAIAAGCSIILRPSEEAPGIVMLLFECCRLAGTPKGVVNLVIGSIKDTYNVLIKEPKIRKITLTGSTDVGKKVAKKSANSLKKVTMELGGNAPTIIFDDVKNIKDLAAKAVAVKHSNVGQVCAAPDRFYVHENIYDDFLSEYVKQIKTIKVGDCLVDETVNMGPLVNAKRLQAIDKSIKKTINDGAILLIGAKRIGDKGFFYTPTVLKDVQDNSVCCCKENFGPISSFSSFKTEEEIITRANNSEYGLTSYIFTQDKDRIKKLVDSIESGMIGINTFMIASAQIPYGGIKQSGYGREGGKYSIIEYCNIKVAHYFYET